MRPALLLVFAASLFAVLPYGPRGGLLAGTLLPMAAAVMFTLAVTGRPSAFALATGAVSGFVGATGWLVLPALGGGLLLLLAYGERTLRVRQPAARGIHLGLAAVAGGIAGTLAASYATGSWTVRGVALVLAAVVSLAPLLVAADDPRTVLLESAATQLGVPLAGPLRAGAELLRCVDARLLDRETGAKVKSSWQSLERLVEARLRLEAGGAPKSETAALVSRMVDKQIVEHLASLTRAYTAATTKGAAEVGLDDSALQGVHARGEALEEESRAIVEVRAS